MSRPIPLTFLGTGNAFAIGRYWNSFLIGGRILVEPSPTVLPNLRRAGADPGAIDTVFVSHFHADHTFGWPFLLLEYEYMTRRSTDLCVIGPAGIQHRFEEMSRIGAYPTNHPHRSTFGINWIEASGTEQRAGNVAFRAVRVEHAPELECYGYLIEHEGRTIGYSGDTTMCEGLRDIAANADVLVLECDHHDRPSPIHMNLDEVRALRRQFPNVPFIITHAGPDVAADGIPNTRLAHDLESFEV